MCTCIRSQLARQSTSIFSIILHWNQVAFQYHLALDNSRVSDQSRKFRFQNSFGSCYLVAVGCHSLNKHRLASRPPVKAALRRATPAALTAPGRDARGNTLRDEGMAACAWRAHAESGTFYFAGTGTFYFAPTLDNSRANYGLSICYNGTRPWRYRLMVRTEPSQGLNTGSTPVSATNNLP